MNQETKSVWAVKASGSGFQLQKNGAPFVAKGVCYSPAPINFSNKDFPAVGDLFWDTYQAGPNNTIYNWYALWGYGHLYDNFYARDDLGTIAAMGATTIRVYSMLSRQGNNDGSIPKPGTGNHFTHKQFLDLCQDKGLSVLVDIPMPPCAFQKYIAPKTNELEFWEYVLDETTRDLADHPAVMGFVIMNELDASPAAFPYTVDPNGQNWRWGPPDANTDYFYSQAAKYAALVKKNAPDKLVGWAIHDAPQLLYYGASFPSTGPTYLEQLSDFDFWGVNTYQSQDLGSVLGQTQVAHGLTYDQLPAKVKKGVIFTEYGWPATGHEGGKLYESATTRQNVADTVTRMFPQAFSSDLLIGLHYFEFSDEWWKQSGSYPDGQPYEIYTWDPTTAAPNNFPNGYWDEEGFGLLSAQRGQGLQPNSPVWSGSGPALPADTLTPRMEIINALKAVFKAAG